MKGNTDTKHLASSLCHLLVLLLLYSYFSVIIDDTLLTSTYLLACSLCSLHNSKLVIGCKPYYHTPAPLLANSPASNFKWYDIFDCETPLLHFVLHLIKIKYSKTFYRMIFNVKEKRGIFVSFLCLSLNIFYSAKVEMGWVTTHERDSNSQL